MMGWRARITIMYLHGMHNYETIIVLLLRRLKTKNGQKFYMVLKGFPYVIIHLIL